jgi:UDP-glucose 4-epimerase
MPLAMPNSFRGGVGDRFLLDDLMSGHEFSAVMHFASYIQVGESVQNPAKYYQNNVYNLGNGNGNGFSVEEVIQSVRRVTGREVPVGEGARRAGDPARLVADSSLIRRELGWSPRYGDLDTMVAHAWAWERKVAGL